MKTLTLFVLSFLLIAPVSAEWLLMMEDEEAKYFVNDEDPEVHPEFVRLWIRTTYAKPTEAGLTGYDAQMDFHREKPQVRGFYLIPKGPGAPAAFFSEDVGEFRWRPIAPGTLYHPLWKIVYNVETGSARLYHQFDKGMNAGKAAPLEPLAGKEAPEITKVVRVLMTTDVGELLIEVYPEAAPNAAARFLELVEARFYDGTPIFRVLKDPEPLIAQFGINSDMTDWKEKSFDDDPSVFQLTRGTLAFAKAGRDTSSTQVFINYRENNSLADPKYNFVTFAQVVEGIEVADQWVSVGDPERGLDQLKLWRDHRSVNEMTFKPNMIERMVIVTVTGDD